MGDVAAAARANHPTVSVCIPVRNGARELGYTLGNLLRGSYPQERLQVLIGDHGSNDQTPEVISEFQTSYPVERVSVPYTGPNRALVRNCLLRRASGELVVFIDHDVLVGHDFVREHVRVHQLEGDALVAGITYGKGALRRDIGALLEGLVLDDIQASLNEIREARELADERLQSGLVANGADICDMSDQLAPQRAFWTCNLSASRRELEQLGGFDEGYVGWGLEDDDLALRFRLAGKRLLFSTTPWSFHLPHASDSWRNLLDWRKNFEVLFHKFPMRELEYYAVFGSELVAGHRRSEKLLNTMRALVVESTAELLHAAIQSGAASCIMHFAPDASTARTLGVTHALTPFEAAQELPKVAGGSRALSLLGLKLPFERRQIAQVLVVVDAWLLLDRFHLSVLLTEAARVAREALLVFGSHARDARFAWALEVFLDAVKHAGFASIECVSSVRGVPAPSLEAS
jgi:glycosyltransferase involved in cell wall biosynthesis